MSIASQLTLYQSILLLSKQYFLNAQKPLYCKTWRIYEFEDSLDDDAFEIINIERWRVDESAEIVYAT
jgi:hypothetical protein